MMKGRKHMMNPGETPVTYLIDGEELLRLEKALRGSEQFLGQPHVPPSVMRDVTESLRLVEDIRGR